ncbi:protein NO VEIN [Hypomesus transpacificus]|uniref:protein NO VEIN n=1 Tax=Hypomesus transpacificus TaxID=137520 RepID=UPI001F086D6F|nr:protein NO VEIN [Hypomesus transpacificus]
MAGGLSLVCYQAALFSNEPRGEVVVGRLGEVSQAQALASLLSCPLLEDLGQWSLWELVFRPLHGPLSDFIDKHAANTDLAALEVTPGSLLRVTTSTGDKFFSQAAMTLDPVGTAGHLVSMVVADGIRNAPTALLANHMESSLAAAVARVDVSLSEEDDACFGTVTRFLLDCLVRIPIRTCQALLQQVFLEPLSRVLGQAKSKSVLLRSARSDPRCLNRLHHLGIVLGITEWARDYQDKLTAPQSPSRPDTVTEDLREGTPVQSGSFSPTPPDTKEEEVAPEAPVDYSANSSHPEQNQDEAEEEESYELTSVPNGHAHDVKHTPGDMEEHTLDAETPLAENEGTEGSSSQSDTDTVNYQKAVIDDIRKSEFGIGVELNAEGQRLMMVHQERLGRSLDRLSTELYSKDTHFVLELIQNADDNSYQPQGGAVAALAFLVDRACITVLNNETGFQEKNVRAICDVGRSTKGKHKHGYIGQKGIGFKSVFKVSDRPEIHSNGFHLRFDKTSGPMGYILPQWVEDQSPLDPPLAGPLAQHSWTTKILLPLRPENQQTRTLFHDIHPSLLLFLHRLRSIVILNPSEKRVVTMTRRDLSHNILEVEHSDGTERWLVVKRTLHPTKVREDVESTELALAFQLKRHDTGSDITALPQKQPVFAFLPLRSFGFRFIIQGDFDIPSSREDVDRDSSWNQWLRSEIPQLLLHALGVFTDHPEFSGLSGLCHFLQFVPLPDEVLDFFKPVAGKIIQLLKGKAFLPTLRKDGVVEYKLPSQVAVCQDAVIRDVIGGEELDRHLSLAYLHPGLQPAPPLSLLTHLGVRHLRGSDVTTVTTAMAQELVQGEGINSAQGLRALARLLVCNFRALQQGYGEADAILQALRELPIIPLADGRVVALGRERVFFPLDDKTSKKTSNTQTGYLGVLHGDVSVVQPGLLSCVEPLERQQVRELLKRLGVHHLEPRHLLQQHIYPALKSHAWKSKPEAVVVSYLVFIKQHSPCSQEFSDPDTAVPVLTSRGLLCPRQDRVHFSKEYGNEDLPKTLPGCEWVLLSDCYVQTDGDVAGWRDLFSRLGVRDRLIIRKERRTLSAKELASSPWAVESALGPCGARGPEGGYVLDDYPSEEFLSLATAQLPAPTLLEQRRALLELLHSHWDTGDQYSQYLTAQVIDSEGRPIKETKSSFSHFLSRLPWVPAYRLQPGGGKEVEYLCPNLVYLFSPEVHSLLGTHVCYVDMQSSDMTNALGMRQTLSVEEVIGYLKKWCVKSKPTFGPEEQEEESEGSEFTSAPEHIHNVYAFLHKNCPPSRLKELFLHNPAIFIEYKRGEEWCSGRFYHLKEVCWSDPTAMFVRYQSLTRGPASPLQEPRVLAPFYGPLEGMRDLFTRLLAVEPSPSMLQYVGLLELVCSSTPLATGDILKDVSVLYAALGEKCKTTRAGDLEHIPQINPSYCSTLKGMLLDKRVFPTKDNTWVGLASRPMVADSRELEKIFKPYREVCLLSLPASDKKAPRTGPLHVRSVVFSEENRALFLEACGVPRLSQQVSTEAQTENFRPCPALQALVASVVPYVQRFLYHHEEMSELYPELLESNIAQSLRQLSYGQVGKLYTRYLLSLADEEAPIVEMTDVICMLKDRREFYIQKDHLSAKLDICRELATLFSTETNHRKELAHFLSGLMTSLNDPAALKRFLLKEDIRDLPENEVVWEVPQPVEAKPEPVFPGGPQAVRAPEEAPSPRQETGEQVLNHWPPRSSLSNAPSNSSERKGTGPLEAVLRMWPPPPGPEDAGREPPPGRCSGEGSDGAPGPPLGQRSTDRPADGNHNLPPRDHTHASHQGAVATSGTSGPGVKRESGVESEPNTDSGSHRTTGRGEPSVEPERERTSGARTQTNLAGSGATRRGSDPDQTSLRNPPDSILVPDAVVSSVFHGAGGVGDCGQRPPLAMDSPVWGKSQQAHPLLEDLELTCQRPTTVVFSEEPRDLDSIGAWGERLVFSFLTHWRDGDEPGRPAHITWSNQNGESGQPYDFKMTFDPPAEEEGEGGGMTREVFVEVKATVKKEKAFIHLSANELDFALREKERYQVFRVYNAGDAQNVRLCRIQNLAQHLHTKDLQLFLFV